jgi:hypothetical protein
MGAMESRSFSNELHSIATHRCIADRRVSIGANPERTQSEPKHPGCSQSTINNLQGHDVCAKRNQLCLGGWPAITRAAP